VLGARVLLFVRHGGAFRERQLMVSREGGWGLGGQPRNGYHAFCRVRR
jgi:hypothetical protein